MADSFASRLPPASFEPEALPSLGTPAAVPVAPFDLAPKAIDPNARASIGGFTTATEDAGGAKLIDLTAREQLGGFKDEFDDAPPDAEPGAEFDDADPLDARTVAELNEDRESFDPVQYFSEFPDVAKDPVRLKKLLDIRRLRDEEGLTARGVIKAAVKGGPEIAKGFVPAAKQAVENVVDVAVQPIVNFVLGPLTGTKNLQEKETQKALFAGPKKSLGELSAAAEASATGMLDLARQGTRKIEDSNRAAGAPAFPGRFSPPGANRRALPKLKTDQQLLAEMADDAAFRKGAVDILGGSGEGAKLVNLDAETLAKEGITLDPKAVEAISLVEPLTMVAGGGVFKILGAANKVIGTARTLAGAEKLVDGLTKYAKTAATLKTAGKATFKTGEVLANKNPSLIAGVHALTTGNITGLAATSAAKFVVSPAAKAMGAEMFDAGRVLAGELSAESASKGVNRLVAAAKVGAETAGAVKEVAKDVFGGAVKGAVASAPFAAASYDDEQAGTLLGAGAILGAGAGAAESGGKAFRVVKNAAAREYFGPNRKPIPAVDSPGYGRVEPLDTLHLEQKKKLSVATSNELDNFREGLRGQGREIYAVDNVTFRQKAAERYKAQTGNDINPALLDQYEKHHALFDETNPDGTKVVYLNADAGGAAALQHDAGHLFDSLLSTEKIAELNTAITKAFPPEAIAEFKKNYEKRVGNKISDEDVLSEFRAEQFGAGFYNTPVSEMAAPKGLLKTFADVVAGGAEAMGVDIAGGSTTPNLGAPQKVGLRNMFESAARTVLELPTPPKKASPAAPAAPSAIPDVTTATPSAIPDVTPAPEIPLGLNRPELVDPSLRVLTEKEFGTERKQATSDVDRLERKLDAGTLTPQERIQLAQAQDKYTSAELEHLRREYSQIDSRDVFDKLLNEPNDARARVLLDVLTERGDSTKSLLSDVLLKSPDESEVFKGKLERVKRLMEAPTARNIRVTPEQTAGLSESSETPAVRAAAAERAKVTGITEARTLAEKSTNPAVSKSVEDISTSMEAGNPVVRVEHLGITSPGGPSAPEGAGVRKATREAGYKELEAAQIEFRENAPADIVSLHEKTFKPLRWDKQGGTPTLIAVSTDKLMANAIRIAKDPKTVGLYPYEVKDNKFTDAGWKEVLADAQTFAENQVNGRKGDGSRLELPKEELGLSIPAEDPNYTPKMLSADRADFQNAIQGIGPPKTAREVKGKTTGNIKGQLVREANKRKAEIPADIPVKYAGKQAFISFPGRVVREVNPFRNELARRGFNIQNLNSAIEKIRAQDIVKSEPRPEIKFSGMVTDTSRAGFSPAPERIREVRKLLEDSIKTGPLKFDTFMSAFREGYFDIDGVPTFSEVMKEFPKSDLPEAYRDLMDEFNGYFKYDNEEISRKFKEAAGNPEKEAAAAEYAERQWNNTQEHLDSRLYEMLKGEPQKLDPSSVYAHPTHDPQPLWMSPEGTIYRGNYNIEQRRPGTFALQNFGGSENKALSQGWSKLEIGPVTIEGAGIISVENKAPLSAPQKRALEALSKSTGHEPVSSSGEAIVSTPRKASGAPQLTQTSLENVDWSEIRRSIQEMPPSEVSSKFSADITKIEDIIETLTLNPQKSPNSFLAADQRALSALHKLGRQQLLERGQSPAGFSPAPTEFRQKNLQGKTVSEFSDYVLTASPGEWKAATENMNGGLTGGAWNLGLGLKDAADVGVLKSFQEKLSTATKEAMTSGDFDSAYSLVSKGQFFREAYEAATGTGSAGAAFKRGQMGTDGVKVPFPTETP